MKYRLLFVLFVLQLSKGNAQFLLKPDGFTTARGNDYYVLEVPGASQQQLFEAVERRVQTSFGSFRDRIAVDPGRELLFQATDRQRLHYYGRDFDVTFQAGFAFKDGKIKVNAPVIKNIRSFNPPEDSVAAVLIVKSPGPVIFLNRGFYVYDKKGKLKNHQLKDLLEKFFNEEILKPLVAIKTNEEW